MKLITCVLSVNQANWLLLCYSAAHNCQLRLIWKAARQLCLPTTVPTMCMFFANLFAQNLLKSTCLFAEELQVR